MNVSECSYVTFNIEFLGTDPSTGLLDDMCTEPHLGRPQMNLQALTDKQKQTLEELWPLWDKDDNKREITASEFMTKLNLKRNTFYKIIKEYEEAI